MIKAPTAVVLTVSSLALATAATACGGSSSGGSNNSGSSGSPAASTQAPSPHPTAAVGQFTKVMEPMGKQAANKVTPHLEKVPGVVRVDYNEQTGRLRVYLGSGITMKQRQRVVQLLADAANG